MANSVFYLTSIGFCVFLCACLSLGETSISSVGVARARAYVENARGLEGLVEWEIAERQKAVITILISHNLFSVMASSFASAWATQEFGRQGIVWATAVMTVVVVVCADYLPKCLGMAMGERTFPFFLPALKGLYVILRPLTHALEKVVLAFSGLFHVKMVLESSIVTRDEIEQLVKSGEESGELEAEERRMIDGVISFDELRVGEIMMPRVNMDALEDTQTLDELLLKIPEWEHSRIPIYHVTPDEIVGVVYLKDLIPYLRDGGKNSLLRDIMREPLFVPETMYVGELFKRMRSERIHFAVVVDEYGGTAGIVTIEDLLEEIVGDIRDEYDEESAGITQLAPGKFRVRCSEPLEDLSAAAGYDFKCDDVDSVGGYVLDKFNGFPKKGDVCSDGDWTVKVLDAAPHRVNEVLFTRRTSELSGAADKITAQEKRNSSSA